MAEFKNKDGVAIIREGTTEIEEKAFYNDTSLECVVIPKGVSKIGESAFEGCTSLTTVILPFSVNEIGSDTFKECLKLTVIYVPAEKVDHYKKLLPGKLHIIKPVYNDMLWEEAIRKVLADEGKPMHYREIMKKIIKNGYRIDYGKTPKNSVGSRLSSNTISSKNSKSKKLFEEVEKGKGVYTLAGTSATAPHSTVSRVAHPVVVRPCSLYAPSDPKYKRASDFVKGSSVLSKLEMDLLELIVNFRLQLENGEVCFADILDKLDVEILEEEGFRPQSVDATILREKLGELKEQIADMVAKAEHNPNLRNEYERKKGLMCSAAEEAEQRLREASGEKIEFNIPILGEFVPGNEESKPKVVIYLKSIEKNLESDENRWDVMAAVFVHEMFHAWNYFKAEQKPRSVLAIDEPMSVLAIDEPMVEFATLYFLKELEAFTKAQKHSLKNNVLTVRSNRASRVQNKQQSIGDLAAYGFGYYLFEEFEKGNVDPIKWIETYSKKSASISRDSTVKNVEKALIPVYPFSSENDVMKWFKKIIFNRQTTYVTTGKSAVKAGSHLSLRDLVLACIETIGRKCFDTQDIYAFAPIFKVCVPQYQNLESALKQQLDALVNEGRLESLPHSCYSMKLASVEVKPKRPVSTLATTTKSKKAPSIAFTVEFPDDNVKFDEKKCS